MFGIVYVGDYSIVVHNKVCENGNIVDNNSILKFSQNLSKIKIK